MTPQRKSDIDFSQVIELCDRFIQEIDQRSEASKIREAERDAFDAMLEAIYGEKVFDWILAKTSHLFLR